MLVPVNEEGELKAEPNGQIPSTPQRESAAWARLQNHPEYDCGDVADKRQKGMILYFGTMDAGGAVATLTDKKRSIPSWPP